MSVIPACRLSRSDLSMLGNNLARQSRCRTSRDPERRRGRRELAAVNRSLATVGEQLVELHWPALLAAR